MSDTIMRQIEMLRMIPRQGKVSPQQLQKRLEAIGYETTERTVQRDLQQLSTIFSLECDDSSRPHGWHWGRDMIAFDLAGLSTPEALALQMLAQFGSGLLPTFMTEQLQPYFAAAKRQLGLDVGPRSARNWTRKVRVVTPNQPLLPAIIGKGVMEQIHAVLLADQCLAIRYRTQQAALSIVHPLGLVQHGTTYYLVVRYEGFDDVRLLAVPRIREAQPVAQRCKAPADFDLDTYIASGGLGFGEVGKTVELEVRLFHGAGEHLKETPLSPDQQLTDVAPGETLVKATVQLTRRLRWWLLAFGPDVEVVKPGFLRKELKSKLSEALARYQA